jgi:hypothetical protein
MKTNKEHLVEMSLQARIHAPTWKKEYKIDQRGFARVLPSVGGIVYNYRIGDCCMKLAGDHIEPGVSLRNEVKPENDSLMNIACIGNRAIVVDGDAKGAEGFVTGKHGGIEHTICYFPADALDKMKIGDQILIRAIGLGLKLTDYPDIACLSLSPELLEKIAPEEVDGKLVVPCVAEVPPYLMGSGIGAASAYTGDYDIMTGDLDALKEYSLDNLRFGDLVLLKDCDNRFGRQYKKGACTLGVIVHSNCIVSGHGPGVTALLSCSEDNLLVGRHDPNANLANYFLGE